MPAEKYKLNKFDAKKFTVKKSNLNGMQDMWWLTYDGKIGLTWEMPWYKITSGGIKKFTEEGVKTNYPVTKDTDREYMHIGLDPEQESLMELRKFAEKLQEWFLSDEGKEKIFGKRADKYLGNPLFTDDPPEFEDEEGNPIPYKGTWIPKIRFSFDVDGKQNKDEVDSRTLKTIVVCKEDGRRVTQKKCKTMTDLAERVRYMSEVRVVFKISHIWAKKQANAATKKKEYGCKLKIMYIEYKPNNTVAEAPKAADFVFDDSDDDELVSDSEEGDLPSGVVSLDDVKEKKIKAKAKKVEEDTDSDSDDDDLVQTKKKGKKGKNTDLDSSSEEDPAPKKKGKKTKLPPPEDSETETTSISDLSDLGDSSSSEDPAPKKKSKKKAVTPESSSEDEPTPKKKGKNLDLDSSSEEDHPPVNEKKGKKKAPTPESSSEEEEPVPKKSKKKSRVLDSSSEEDEPPVSSKKKKKSRA